MGKREGRPTGKVGESNGRKEEGDKREEEEEGRKGRSDGWPSRWLAIKAMEMGQMDPSKAKKRERPGKQSPAGSNWDECQPGDRKNQFGAFVGEAEDEKRVPVPVLSPA